MSRNYVPGVIVQGRGLRGPKGDPGDMTDASTYFQATSLMSDYADLSHVHGTVLGHNVSVTSASDGMTLSVAALGAAANAVCTVAGGYASLNIVGANTTVSVTGVQSAGAYLTTAAGWDSVYLTTAARSTHIHGSVNITTIAGTDVTYSSASSGLTLGIPAFLTTANEIWHSHTDAMSISERDNYFYTSANTFANNTHTHGSNISFGNTTNATESVVRASSSSNGLTMVIPKFLTTAANTTHTHGGSTISGYNISGSSNSSGLTLSVGNAIALTNSTHFVNTTVSNSFIRSWELEGNNTAGTTGSLIGSVIYFKGGDNITLSGSSNTIVISGNPGGGTGGVALGNTATVPFTSGSVMFQGTNVTINTSAGAGGDSTKQYINLVVADPVTGAVGALGNTATSNKFGTGTVMFSGSNITVNLSSDGASQWVQLVGADPAAAANTVRTVAGGYVSLSVDGVSTTVSVTGLQPTANMSDYIKTGGLIFSNTNGIYFGTAGAGSSTTVTAEFSSNLFFPEAYSSNLQAVSNSSLSLAASYVSHTHGANVSFGVTSNSAENLMRASSSSNGLTLVVPSYLTTAAQSGHTHGSLPSITGGIGVSSNSTAWSISIPAFITTAAQVSHSHGANTFSFSNFSSSSTSSASNGLTLGLTGYPSTSFVNVSDTGNVYFENGSGVSFGSTYSSLSTTITGSIDSGNVYFVNPNGTSGSNMTFGSSTSGNSTSIFITAGGGTGGGGGIAIANSAATISDSTVIFSNSNGIGWGISGSTLTASYTVPASGTLSLVNANGISFISSSDGSTTSISASVETAYMGLNSSNSYMKSWAVYGNTSSQTSGIIYNGSLKIHASDNVTIRGASDGLTFIGAGVSGAAGTGFSSTSTSGSVLTGTLNNSGMSFGVPAWITTAAAANHTHSDYVGLASTGVTGASATINSSQLYVNIPQGSVYYNDSNGIIFGASSSSLSTTITASVTQSYVLSGNNSDTTAFTAGPNLTLVGSDNITLKADSNGRIAIMGASGGAGGGDWATSAIAGTGISILTGAATNTLQYGPFITGYTESTHAFTQYVGLTSTGISGGSATIASDQLLINIPAQSTHAFTQYVGLTSTAITGGSATIASDQLLINIPTATQFAGLASTGVTGGDATINSSQIYINVTGRIGNSISTVATSGSVLLGSAGSAGLSLSVPAWLTTAGGGGAASASNGSFTFNTLSFGSSGITFHTNASGLQGSYTVPASGTLSLVNSNGVTWGTATSGSTTTVTASVGFIWSIISSAGGSTAGTASSVFSVLNLIAGSGVTLSGGSGGITFKVA